MEKQIANAKIVKDKCNAKHRHIVHPISLSLHVCACVCVWQYSQLMIASKVQLHKEKVGQTKRGQCSDVDREGAGDGGLWGLLIKPSFGRY